MIAIDIAAAERAEILAEQRADLWRLQGAVLEGNWVKYWPVAMGKGRDGALPLRTAVGQNKGRIFSGHRDWTRGRHWDRRQRYGVR